MTRRFHINPKTGNPGQCSASTKPCPFGLAKEDHFHSKAAAQAWYEEQNPTFPQKTVSENEVWKAEERQFKSTLSAHYKWLSGSEDFAEAAKERELAVKDHYRIAHSFLKQERENITEEDLQSYMDYVADRGTAIAEMEAENEETYQRELELLKEKTTGLLESFKTLEKAYADEDFKSKIVKNASEYAWPISQKYFDKRDVEELIQRAHEELQKNHSLRYGITLQDLANGQKWIGNNSMFRRTFSDRGISKLMNDLVSYSQV